MTQIFLVNQNAAGSFPDPGNWNSANNSVEVVGSGGYGASAPTGSGCTQPPCRAYETPLRGERVWEHFDINQRSNNQFVWNGDQPYTVEEQNWTPPTSRDYPTVGSVVGSGAGGGGGGYAKDVNLSPTFPWPYYIQGSVSTSGGVRYYTVWGRNTNTPQPPQTPGWVWAPMGAGGFDGGSGAPAGWPNGQVGGNGGLGGSTASTIGGGGGGAGGPHGAGTNGASGVGGGAGGAADGGTVPGGAAGASGNSSTQWDATHGVGSGSGGGTSTHFPGGAAANYGGGAGGGYGDVNGGGISVAGGQSIIVVTYTPAVSAGSAFIIV